MALWLGASVNTLANFTFSLPPVFCDCLPCPLERNQVKRYSCRKAQTGKESHQTPPNIMKTQPTPCNPSYTFLLLLHSKCDKVSHWQLQTGKVTRNYEKLLGSSHFILLERNLWSIIYIKASLGIVVGTTPRLRAGHSEFRIPLRKRNFCRLQNVLSDTGAQPASSTRDNVVLSPVGRGGRSGRGVKVNYLHLVPRLRISGDIAPISIRLIPFCM